jgi:hypothetical protein
VVLHAVPDGVDQVLAQHLGGGDLDALGVERRQVLGQGRECLGRGVARQQHVLQVGRVALWHRAFHGGAVGAEGHDGLRGGWVGGVEEDEGAVFGVGQVVPGFGADGRVGVIHQGPAHDGVVAGGFHESGTNRRLVFRTAQARQQVAEGVDQRDRIEHPALLRRFQQGGGEFYARVAGVGRLHGQGKRAERGECLAYFAVGGQGGRVLQLVRWQAAVVAGVAYGVDAGGEDRAAEEVPRRVDALAAEHRAGRALVGAAHRPPQRRSKPKCPGLAGGLSVAMTES